jgi:superfamily II DNA or RNA helicase
MSDWNEKYTLSPHQTKAVQSVIHAWTGQLTGSPMKRAMIVACTAFGKTILGSRLMWLAMRRGYKSLFIVDRDELVTQTVKKLYAAAGIIADIEKAADKASLEADVVVASVQSLQNEERLSRYPKNHFGVVIADECHMSMSPAWQKVLKYFDEEPATKLLGVTATPARGDRKNLMKFWQGIAFKMDLFDGINNGLVVPIKVHQMDVSDIDIEKVELDCEEQVGLAEAMLPIWDRIIDEWSKVAGNRKTLWFHPTRASSEAFSKRLLERGYSSKHVSGISKDRAVIIESFARNQFQNLNNAVLLMTGYDDDQISCVVPLRSMGSKVQYQQTVGRGIRLYCGKGCRDYRACTCEDKKKDLLLFDVFGSFPRLSVMTPADLCSDSPEHIAEMKKRLKAKQGVLDLQEESIILAGDREQALIRDIKKAKKHGRKTVYDARYVATLYGDHDLFDYDADSQGEWASLPPLQPQVDFLIQKGVSPDSIVNRGHAYRMITMLNNSWKAGAPSILQLGRLQELGIETKGLTKEQANKLLDEYAPSKRYR